jgi:uncharacterized RDD family membrane protein YckC
MTIPRILILNFFTKSYLKQADRIPFVNPRMKSMVCELWFVMAIVMPLFIIASIPFFIFQSNYSTDKNLVSFYSLITLIPWLILLFITLNKDCLNGRSAGKRTFGFKIVDYKTKDPANNFQCMLRNITMYAWPLEVIMILTNPGRRIGDFIANTEVIKTETKPIESLIIELTEKQLLSGKLIVTSIGVSILLTLIAFWWKIL